MPKNLPLVTWSSIGKKVLMGVTGLGLCLFVTTHLAGNLLLFLGADAFNRYSFSIERMGGLLYLAEAALLAVFLIHIVAAFGFVWQNRKARPQAYRKYASGGPPSRRSLSSSTMIYTGVLLLIFTVLHLKTFKFGPGMAEGYVTQVEGAPARDLYRRVVEVFHDPWYVAWYVAAMLFLGFHLRHGFWSAFQSLGAYDRRYTPYIYTVGMAFAAVIAAGFIVLPVWIYFH